MPSEVTIDQLADALSSGAYVLDVRTPDEYAEKRVPGAVLIPLAELGDRVEEVPDDQPVYVICATGVRSMRAAEALERAGWEALNVAGGTNAWVESGRDFDSGE